MSEQVLTDAQENVNSPSPLTYSRKILIKEHDIGMNVLIDGRNGKSTLFFLPLPSESDDDIQNGSDDDDDAIIHVPANTPPIDLSFTSTFNSRINLPERNIRLSTSSTNSNIGEVSMFNHVPEDADIEISANNEVHNFENIPIAEDPGTFQMFTIPDNMINEEFLNGYRDCSKITDLLMIFLTNQFQCGDDPDFMMYKRDINVVNKYWKKCSDIMNDVHCVPRRKRKFTISLTSEDESDSDDTKKTKSEVSKTDVQQIISTEDVILGPNGTTITSEQFGTINWSSTSLATRTLLSILFSREILASHSLTGRSSPGRERQKKPHLNPDIIQDIVHMVQLQTNGTEREIRQAISTKCFDTAKFYLGQSSKM